MKAVLIFSLLIIVLSDSINVLDTLQGRCTSVTYGAENDPCIPGFNSTKTCKAFLACRGGVCKKAHIGAACKVDTDCYANNPLYGGSRCVQEKCIKPRYNGFGCSDPRHCWSNKCTFGRCSGEPYGASCDPAKLVSCEQGYYCSLASKTCEMQKYESDYCSDYHNEEKPENQIPHGSNYNVICAGGLKCSGPYQNKYCIRWKDSKLGYPCNPENGDDTCRFGLRCSRNRAICVDDSQEYETWQCAGAGRNCTFANEEECICQKDGKGACQRVYELQKCNFNEVGNRYRDCIEQNNCAYERSFLTSMELNILDQETCIGKFCANEVLQTLCCGFEKYVKLDYTPANLPPYCSTGNPGLAVFLVLFFLCLGAIALGIVFIIVGGVIYFIIKRKTPSGDGIYSNKGEFESLE